MTVSLEITQAEYVGLIEIAAKLRHESVSSLLTMLAYTVLGLSEEEKPMDSEFLGASN